MYPLAISFPTLAVSAIYLLWQVYENSRRRPERLQRDRLLHERVACLLWTAAMLPEPGEAATIRPCASAPTPLWQPRCSILTLPPPAKRRRA
jgi:hypothetical protein